MKSDIAIIAQKTGRTPVEDLDSSFSTFGEVQQVEVIKGSGVFCQAEVWKAVRLATSATGMVRNLLLGTFKLETLLKINLNGGKPTRGDGEQLVALDQIKKAAIIDATLKKWPAASRGQIGVYQLEAHGAEKINEIKQFFSCSVFFVLLLFLYDIFVLVVAYGDDQLVLVLN